MGCRRRVRAMPATAALLCVALLSGTARPIQALARRAPSAGQRIALLEEGMATECALSRGEEHLYRVALTAGEYVSVIVEQRGIDVVVQTRGTDGTVDRRFPGRDQTAGSGAGRSGGRGSRRVHPGDQAWTAAPVPAPMRFAWPAVVPATDADRSMQESRTLRTAAAGLESAAKLDDARRLFERALTIGEAVRGPDDVFVGVLLFDLAGNALEARDDARAESLYQRAIAVLEKTWGAEHPYPAMARSRLALLLRARRSGAEGRSAAPAGDRGHREDAGNRSIRGLRSA